jgi:predicted RNase H-like HicB family nuclease
MTHVNRFKVRLIHSDEGVAVSCPALPGCWSQGETEEEALENIADAIREYLAAAEETEHEGESREVEVAV